MKTLRYGLSFLLTLCILVFFSGANVKAESEIPNATSDFYVNDFAGVLSEAQKSEMQKKAVELASKEEGAQIVVTTIKSLNGENLEEYTNAMYNKYKIGRDDLGILVLISIEDRQIRVETGRKMEVYITASQAGNFIRDKDVYSYLKQSKFAEALVTLQDNLIKTVDSKIQIEKANAVTPTENDTKDSSSSVASGSSEKQNGVSAWLLIFLVFMIASMGVAIFEFISKKNLEKENEEKDEKLAKERKESEEQRIRITDLYEQIMRTENMYKRKLAEKDKADKKVISDLQVYKTKYEYAVRLHSDLEKEILDEKKREKEAFDRKAAKEYNAKMDSVCVLDAASKNVDKFERVLSEYKDLNKRQMSYIDTSRYEQVENLLKKSREICEREYDEKCKKDAKEFCDDVERIVSYGFRATYYDYRQLDNLVSCFQGLPKRTRGYCNESVISNLNSSYAEAKKDKKRIEREKREEEERKERERREKERRRREEEERRRRNSYHHDDYGGFGGGFGGGSSSGGGFGGFGGTSSGGGASSGF